ncbi:site-2 protease family protein [Alkalibacter sp. M17DMB]|nr:site-2 protease family protein [Alkalibacter mobilis]
MNNIKDFIYIVPALLISLTFHELAHGLVAYKLGDPTAKSMGRLTLNPIKHIDPTGLLMLFLFRFGWAKPVVYNPEYFENKKMGTLLVALAGPVANVIIATISMGLLIATNGIWSSFLGMLFQFNVVFAVFNMLPVPPLDGSKVLASILPENLSFFIWKYEKIGYMILLGLAVSGMVSKIIFPIYNYLAVGIINLVQIFL